MSDRINFVLLLNGPVTSDRNRIDTFHPCFSYYLALALVPSLSFRSFFVTFFVYQRILQELKDVIESMRWASAEELRLKGREIDALKEESIKSNAAREESLETQRRY